MYHRTNLTKRETHVIIMAILLIVFVCLAMFGILMVNIIYFILQAFGLTIPISPIIISLVALAITTLYKIRKLR